MRQQTYLIAATLAEGRGVLLSETCATCDRDLRSCGAIVCPVCSLQYCTDVCWNQHVDGDARCTAEAMAAAVERAKRDRDRDELVIRYIASVDRARRSLP